ncbi:ATP-binding cassette domain-containing protein [Blastococcus sp. MG754426]|uniref:ABC transporter ATP-binding protein n=1 Tax=unclassified Blastococcus TaxID=2619396 RepID=UPI001EF0DBDD|nr:MULTISPECIES: ATP-binding cassette domain-containing protein [unclassified Blastococcus]MCF6507685.1 ATP-binding cassette domain-containing protein [Blastococcus sp. MG754426]MCF6511176.1 ATP-binding cassette domain-containing protein [Blastococcus sp. MG754427]MCF6735365.1 ATP-binding cassette domain-containing protein [Blastococcus sp. KM273129]
MPETASAAAAGTAGDDRRISGVPIRLEGVTKRYPGQDRPAVDDVDLEIAAGETVMFVGPSGCGKTTLLKMLNRLIEPTSGRIHLGDEDVTDQDADQLRRRIGYVIQAGGLFPHMTVATNVGMVPRMLRWDKQRTAARIDELLELVGLDPAVYRDRYPRELSGGQQQRVGVARALAADPPVLLMDEPFGAVDPVTRQRLQDELLRIQEELGKTIVFVTHDFDEAVKLGDRIVVFDVGARVVQYDTPERILAEPAEDYVADFVGAGATLKQLTLTRVGDVDLVQVTTAVAGSPSAEAVAAAQAAGDDFVVVLDSRGRPISWPTVAELTRTTTVPHTVDERLPVVGLRSTLNDALDTMLAASQGGVVVTGRRDGLAGVMAVETVMAAIQRSRTETAG